jgi:hypothetical protein
MNDYKEFQPGWIIFVTLILAQLLITYLYFNELGDKPLDINSFIIISVLNALTCLLFYGLTTVITVDKITVYFGIGIIRKSILINRIKSVEAVRNPWYYGWGIRFIPKGMLYNISGLDGVELKFKDTNRVIRIGTKEPIKLTEEVNKRLKTEP